MLNKLKNHLDQVFFYLFQNLNNLTKIIIHVYHSNEQLYITYIQVNNKNIYNKIIKNF